MNAAIDGTELDGKPMSDVIAAARGSNQGLLTMPRKVGITLSIGIHLARMAAHHQAN